MLWIFICESQICLSSLASVSGLILKGWCETVDFSFLSIFEATKEINISYFLFFSQIPVFMANRVTFWVAMAWLLLRIVEIISAPPSSLVEEGKMCLWYAAVALPGVEAESKKHRSVIWWLVWIIVTQMLNLRLCKAVYCCSFLWIFYNS